MKIVKKGTKKITEEGLCFKDYTFDCEGGPYDIDKAIELLRKEDEKQTT